MVGTSACKTAPVYTHRPLFVAVSMTTKMILPVVLIFISTAFAQDLNEDDPCTTSDGNPGVCTLLNKCSIIQRQLMAGNSLDSICGHSGLDPVVCCPTNSPSSTSQSRAPVITATPVGDGRGQIARQKCAEYVQYVWSLKYAATLIGNRQQVNTSDCAITSQKLIVGGTKAQRMEFPHIAALGYEPAGMILWKCGGSLISENFVLTAAHCIYNHELGYVEWVRVGDLNLVREDDYASPVDRRISKRIPHPEYKRPAQYHDIALLRLESRVPFNAWIRPACLHTAPSTGTEKAITIGWGRVAWGEDEGSSDLLKVTLPLVDQQTCNTSYRNVPILKNGIIEEQIICAGKNGSDTCQGDSGGPLVIYSSQDYYCMYDVVGVTSLGQLCGEGIPGVYTRVYHYINWIEPIVWGQG